MFSLKIDLSADEIDILKSELTHKLPEVKSSHRCEALARGLGSRSYAALRALLKKTTLEKVPVRGDLFRIYLADHGFNVQPKQLYQAAAKVALRKIFELEPRLTAWGIGSGRPRRKEDGRWENSDEMNSRFQQDRAELISDDAVESFLASQALLARVTPTKTIRNGTGSYRLKHIAEKYPCTYPDGEKLGPTYVANGIFIAAALHAGFKIKTYMDELGYADLNVSFNMSKLCVEDLDCEIRPDGARAQNRRHHEQMLGYRH